MKSGRAAVPRDMMSTRVASPASAGQAYTEYVVILAVLLGVGLAATSVMVSFDVLDDIFIDYYGSVANYLNLPFF